MTPFDRAHRTRLAAEAEIGPPRAAVGGFPYPARNQREVREDEERMMRKAA